MFWVKIRACFVIYKVMLLCPKTDIHIGGKNMFFQKNMIVIPNKNFTADSIRLV